MLPASPDHRSRKVLFNLHLVLVSSIFILFIVLTSVVFSTTSSGAGALLSALFLTTGISSCLELVIMVCARQFFRANAFLQKGYRSLLNYECSYALYSLPHIIFSLIFYWFSTCARYLNPSVGSGQIPESCVYFALVYYMSFVLGPLIILIFFIFAFTAACLLTGKLIILVLGAYRAHRGKVMKYPLAIAFLQ
jgi:uncharacterized Tic20 family protein